MNRRNMRVIRTAAIACAATAALVIGSQAESREKARQDTMKPGATSGQAPTAARSGAADNGKALYEKYGCWACHGYEGQGGAAPRLAPKPIALARFTAIVRRPPNQMPPYTAKVVSDAELADIHAYLGTIPAPPDPSTIPLLQEKKGQ